MVKAMDLIKSIGVSPRRLKCCRLRKIDVDFGFAQRIFLFHYLAALRNAMERPKVEASRKT